MFRKDNKYFMLGVTLLLVIIISILFYVLLTNIGIVYGAVMDLLDICSSVIYGFAFAYIMNPVMMATEKIVKKLFGRANITERGLKKLSRAIGVTVAVIVFIAVVYGLIAMVVPELVESLKDLDPEDIYDTANNLINKLVKGTRLSNWFKTRDPLKYLFNWLTKERDWANTVNVAFNEVYGWGKTIFNMLIGIVVAIYLLIAKERFISQAKKLVVSMFKPKRANRILEISRLTNQSLGGFFVGKLIDSLIIGVISYVGMLILDLPYPLIASVFVGLTNIIPFFGPLIGIVIGGVLIVLKSPIDALYFVIFELLLQQVDGNIIGPRILGGKLGISDFWVLVSITVFGGLFGFPGMLLGVPVFTVIYTLITQAVNSALRKKKQPLDSDAYYRIITVEDLELYRKDYHDSTVFYSGDTYEVEYDPDDDFEYELPDGQ